MSTAEMKERIQLLESELKRKCREVDDLKSSFLGNISHEIRTPMNAIMGFSCLLQDPDLTDEDKCLFVDGIMKSSKNLLKIVDNIIEASKLESNEVNLNIRKFNVAELLSEIYHSYTGQVTKDVDFRFNCCSDDIIMYSDPAKIKAMITNLLDNAIKFTDKGFIELGCQPYSANLMEFHVQDTGIGIAEENREDIFDKFNQIETSRSKKYTGLGIGLTLARQLSDLLGGDMKLDSGLGSGTTFTVLLPADLSSNVQPLNQKLKEKDIFIEELQPKSKSSKLKNIQREFSVRSKYSNYRA